MAQTDSTRKNWLKSALVRLTSSDRAQQILEGRVRFMLELMGIGSAGSVGWSGEKRLGRMLHERYVLSGYPLCIFDVGAHSGQFLQQVIEPLVDAGVPVLTHAFEPSPTAFRALQAVFKERTDVSLNNFGFGRQAGEFQLFANAAGSTLASLSRRRLQHLDLDFNTSERVKIERLDDYCLEHHIEKIDLLKLDVEGHEMDVLNGGVRMFRERRVAILSFEFGGADIDSRTFFQDFWYFFRSTGTGMLYRLTPSGRMVPLLEYKELYEQFCPTVFVYLQPGL